MKNDMIKDEAHRLSVSKQCKKWWRRHRFALLSKWRAMGFKSDERKFLKDGLSDINPYYHPNGIALSYKVSHEYERMWLKRGREHPDTAYWM